MVGGWQIIVVGLVHLPACQARCISIFLSRTANQGSHNYNYSICGVPSDLGTYLGHVRTRESHSPDRGGLRRTIPGTGNESGELFLKHVNNQDSHYWDMQGTVIAIPRMDKDPGKLLLGWKRTGERNFWNRQMKMQDSHSSDR